MKKVYMIGNTHFDPVWLWKWDEAMSSISATFRSALQRMNEYPEFKYSFATPPVFEWIKETDPETFEEIKKRIAEGRWELAEGWWLQPDCYTPCGESLVRQGLYGQSYLVENFGRRSVSVFNIDCFGHPPTLPQILSKSGIKYYVFRRPEGIHIKLDKPLFNWTSLDGSSVLTYRDDDPYMGDTADEIENAKKLPYDSLKVYGVTDHGGAPTIRSIEKIRESENAVFATVNEFFSGRETDFTLKRELVTGDFGVYANHTDIKALNRKAEYALLNAEKSSVIANNYKKDTLKKCWHDVLFNQFHDILGGACIKEAFFDAENKYGRAITTANEIMHFNLLRITNKINMPGKNPENEWNLVVWNLNADSYNGYIEAEVQWLHEFPEYYQGITLEDGEGNRYDCQIIRERSVIPGFRTRFLFKAEIPAMGYKAFKVVKTYEDVKRRSLRDPRRVETEGYFINLSENGEIESIYDKTKGKTVQGRLLNPICFADDGDTWAFNIDSYGKQLESFKLEKIEEVENGPIRNIIKATYSFRSSKLELYYSIYAKADYIDVRYRVNWNEKHAVFKLVSDLCGDIHTVAVPYGSIERGESKAEVPMGEWIKTDNLTIAADHIFSYTAIDKKLGLTVLRSPIYGDLRLSDIDLDVDYEIMGQGITEGSVRVSFESKERATAFSAELNNPPIVLCEANHTGVLEDCASYLSVEAESVCLTTLKKAESGSHTVIRGAEYIGRAQEIKIFFKGNSYEVNVSPYEIFTLLIEGENVKKVNMLEDNE